MDITKLEQLIYEVELFTTASTEAQLLDKVRYVTDFFEMIVMELQADYYLQQSIEQMGDKRKKDLDGKEDWWASTR